MVMACSTSRDYTINSPDGAITIKYFAKTEAPWNPDSQRGVEVWHDVVQPTLQSGTLGAIT
jgi:hypothetical protein